MPLPKNFAPDHPFDHGNRGGRDEVLVPRPLTPELIRNELAVYYALVEHLDAQLGRIVDALAQRDELDNTIVIFTSDHGLAVGSHGLFGKQNMYDHTIGVPLVMAGPGIPQGQTLRAQCYLRDLFPTICEWGGAEVPADLDGRSLRPLLDGTKQELRFDVVGYFTDTQRMIRGERWKYIRYPKAGREQLFDLKNDPNELTNLIDVPEHTALKTELRIRLGIWLYEHGDPLMRK
jgi:arylsulfatase A-like enzyme